LIAIDWIIFFHLELSLVRRQKTVDTYESSIVRGNPSKSV